MWPNTCLLCPTDRLLISVSLRGRIVPSPALVGSRITGIRSTDNSFVWPIAGGALYRVAMTQNGLAAEAANDAGSLAPSFISPGPGPWS